MNFCNCTLPYMNPRACENCHNNDSAVGFGPVHEFDYRLSEEPEWWKERITLVKTEGTSDEHK